MPFAKGQSGNPQGRPRAPRALAPALRALLNKRPEPDGPTNRDLLAARLIELALHGEEAPAISAIKTIFERVDGKVPDNLYLSGAAGGPIQGAVQIYIPDNERD